ncbi:PREDICTED: neuropeptide B [Chinchilla lanigera]|uniref:neuropeptide B n=1 Tax=Chinchilla lanigera TaxID=34839 RepID=UPI00038E9B51|nr:PREDICTED: neuropeptide B [Chinchilla lanigera]
MARCTKLVMGALALCLLLGPPSLAWYKPSAGFRYYSVGRAAGLLSGFRGAQSARRSEPVDGLVFPRSRRAAASGELRPGLQTLASVRGWPPTAMCIQDVAPHLQNCEQLRDDRGTFQCTANVFLSLSTADCRRA